MSPRQASRETATERVVVLMTPKQKAEVGRRAKAAKLTVGDFIRRQTFGDEDVLAAMVAQLQESTASANAALDRALATITQAKKDSAAAREAAMGRAKAEFANVSPEAFASLVTGLAGTEEAAAGGAR